MTINNSRFEMNAYFILQTMNKYWINKKNPCMFDELNMFLCLDIEIVS